MTFFSFFSEIRPSSATWTRSGRTSSAFPCPRDSGREGCSRESSTSSSTCSTRTQTPRTTRAPTGRVRGRGRSRGRRHRSRPRGRGRRDRGPWRRRNRWRARTSTSDRFIIIFILFFARIIRRSFQFLLYFFLSVYCGPPRVAPWNESDPFDTKSELFANIIVMQV